MSQTFEQLATKLDLILRDTSDLRWTDAEKDEAVTEAIGDPACANWVEDSSLTASTSTQTYAVPATLDRIFKVWITDSGGTKYNVSSSSWRQNGTNLFFVDNAPNDGTMTLGGWKQLTTSDSIPENMVHFVLYRAARVCHEMLMHKYMAGFLTNDVSMPELLSSMSYIEKRESSERAKLGSATTRLGYEI